MKENRTAIPETKVPMDAKSESDMGDPLESVSPPTFQTCRQTSTGAQRQLLSRTRCCIQQLSQIGLPHCRPGMRAMPVRLIGNGDQHEVAVLQALRFPFRDAELRRIDEIVSRVDPHHPRCDLF